MLDFREMLRAIVCVKDGRILVNPIVLMTVYPLAFLCTILTLSRSHNMDQIIAWIPNDALACAMVAGFLSTLVLVGLDRYVLSYYRNALGDVPKAMAEGDVEKVTRKTTYNSKYTIFMLVLCIVSPAVILAAMIMISSKVDWLNIQNPAFDAIIVGLVAPIFAYYFDVKALHGIADGTLTTKQAFGNLLEDVEAFRADTAATVQAAAQAVNGLSDTIKTLSTLKKDALDRGDYQAAGVLDKQILDLQAKS